MNKYVKRYFVDTLGGMALGLFATLIIGLILKQIGSVFPVVSVGETDVSRVKFLLSCIGTFFTNLGLCLTVLTGSGIALGVAHSLGVPKLVLYATAASGLVGAYSGSFISGSLFSETGALILSGPGDPLGAFVAALAGAEAGRLVSGKTKIDILITPAVTIAAGGLAGVLFGPPLASASQALGVFIKTATELQPFWMGIIISVVMGLILTLPISSAAIGIILGLSGLAGGAATAGCCAQMVGFAVISFKDNGLNGFFAQGLGTSMLQIPNIIKNPLIWVPPTLASAVTGPLSTLVFKMKNLPAGSGMGTSGLVGPLLCYQAMTGSGTEAVSGWLVILYMVLLYFILPGILSYAIYFFMHKKGWIKDGDMKLSTL